MALHLLINGTSVPTPKRGMAETISTNVNSGRNAQGEMVGERVGRDIYKLDNLEWMWLTKKQWKDILKLVEDFKFQCTFPDVMKVAGEDGNENAWTTLTCYCGDRTAEPYYINDSGDFTYYRSCKMNIIDVGIVDEN